METPKIFTGQACLCFTNDNQSFQGYMTFADKKQIALTGIADHSHVIHNECCYDGKPISYSVDIIEYESGEYHHFNEIIREGGDNCSLVSKNINFHTEQLLAGPKAEDCREKFFQYMRKSDCYVCYGILTFSL